MRAVVQRRTEESLEEGRDLKGLARQLNYLNQIFPEVVAPIKDQVHQEVLKAKIREGVEFTQQEAKKLSS
ncbi:MAG: hypothetical protein HY399_08165 [Elusimicrobia bacterium]|nr:hypothetical protein [Elusimicrobiota bacterium]